MPEKLTFLSLYDQLGKQGTPFHLDHSPFYFRGLQMLWFLTHPRPTILG